MIVALSGLEFLDRELDLEVESPFINTIAARFLDVMSVSAFRGQSGQVPANDISVESDYAPDDARMTDGQAQGSTILDVVELRSRRRHRE